MLPGALLPEGDILHGGQTAGKRGDIPPRRQRPATELPGAQGESQQVARRAHHRAVNAEGAVQQVIPDQGGEQPGQQSGAEGAPSERMPRKAAAAAPGSAGTRRNRPAPGYRRYPGTAKATATAARPVSRFTARSRNSWVLSDIPGRRGNRVSQTSPTAALLRKPSAADRMMETWRP